MICLSFFGFLHQKTGFFSKLKDFSLKLKVSEILLFLKPQNGWKKAWLNTQRVRLNQLPKFNRFRATSTQGLAIKNHLVDFAFLMLRTFFNNPHGPLEGAILILWIGMFSFVVQLSDWATPHHPKFIKSGAASIVQLIHSWPMCVEAFSNFPPLGTFAFRDWRTVILIKWVQILLLCWNTMESKTKAAILLRRAEF